MPKDKAGKFHFNSAQARHADKAGMAKPTPGSMTDAPTEAPHNEGEAQIGHHLMSQAAEHGGKHMHVTEKDGGGYTSHHVGHEGAVEGPHDHENLDSLKEHMGKFFDEESAEGEPAMAHHGGPPLHGM